MATESTSKVDRAPEYKNRDRTLTCRGVGAGSQSSDWDVRHTIALGTGRLDTYTAPELPDSCVPGILGRLSMKGLRALLDTFTGVMYLVGPGGYELRLSPGSEKHDLHESAMGHLMLPCSNFGPQNGQKNDESINFVVGDFFAGQSKETNKWNWNEDWEEPEDFWIAKKSCPATPHRVGKHSSSSGVAPPSS